MSAARRATTVIAANRFSVFKLSKERPATGNEGRRREEREEDEDHEEVGTEITPIGEHQDERRGKRPKEGEGEEDREVRPTAKEMLSRTPNDQLAGATDERRATGGKLSRRSHSSPLGASSHLPGWAARRARRLAEVLTVPERGAGEEEGASTRTRLRAGVGEDKADEEEEDTDIGEEVRRCLFLGDRRMEGFLDELASFEGVCLLAGVDDGPATGAGGAGGAEDEDGVDSEGRAADREERRRPAELARRRTKDEGGAGGGD
ncbi:hypothetical protein TREMEDRAFT_61936 [Tremella mesenterica DSM 1558]|uniref:uncharacterized protein n=1 Tax=Tremella mesenterica (strain ATCC 24925 / CBS 8224 / DSM 1558 / NBRC 9311 / NRRL Y-6157 / RJB 2259-6 / UBC 559-6) TaxID=578456 RepID=UPI0003F49CBB|nr:uncharacterized protein TREMEDRAFT_61936 [Tremella mesenterica DSM 1558]EIW70173.1 hypothetical protein TREMEDRAFT_61936 [Tremella mesenterica DSM 1558]